METLGLSVLIPNYNYPCLKLVQDLHTQLEASGVPYEIIVAEDGSTKYLEENAPMARLSHVKYLPRTQNTGRFKIRQFLPTQAQYPYLLCMDSDAEVIRPDYIEKYITLAKTVPQAVITGGLAAPAQDPGLQYRLRYRYTLQRESKLSVRKGFTAFNCMIPAAVARSVQMPDESLFEHYGHEDTLYGILLRRTGVEILSIDNPLRHLGMETNTDMLRKSVWAAQNLLRFHATGLYPELQTESRLLGLCLKIRRLHGAGIFTACYRPWARCIERNLLGKHPSLRLFDLYRLNAVLKSFRPA